MTKDYEPDNTRPTIEGQGEKPTTTKEMITYEYDEKADVLYVTFASGKKAFETSDVNGVLARFDETGKLIGITIIDFNRWTK